MMHCVFIFNIYVCRESGSPKTKSNIKAVFSFIKSSEKIFLFHFMYGLILLPST